MKRGNSIFTGCQGVVLAIAVIAAGLPVLAYCQMDGTALLLQKTPVEGGTISPSAGVHNFELYTEVTLTAVPNPGFQFVYWMGDVSDLTANSTIVYLDAPKIIIAVFERAEYEFLAVKERATSAPGGGLRRSAADYARAGGGGAGGRRPPKFRPPGPPEPEEPEPEDFPVPEQGEEYFPVPEQGEEDFPVPVPEPATAVLLVLGSFFAARWGAKKQVA